MKHFVIYDSNNQCTLLLSELSSTTITDFSSLTLFFFFKLYRSDIDLPKSTASSLQLFHDETVSSTTAPKFI